MVTVSFITASNSKNPIQNLDISLKKPEYQNRLLQQSFSGESYIKIWSEKAVEPDNGKYYASENVALGTYTPGDDITIKL